MFHQVQVQVPSHCFGAFFFLKACELSVGWQFTDETDLLDWLFMSFLELQHSEDGFCISNPEAESGGSFKVLVK